MRRTLFATLGFFVAASCFAWGANGHRIVAQVGEDRLSEEILERVLQVTDGQSLAQIATWPDFIRSERQWNCSQPWHFLTVEDWETVDEAVAKPGSFRNCDLPRGVDLPQNAVQAIDFFSDLLKGDATKLAAFEALASANDAKFLNDSPQASALSFLVHLIGDVHQPLHVGRGPDLGGNRVAVNWFDEPSNLHSTWDEGLIASENLSYSEFVAFLDAAPADEMTTGRDCDRRTGRGDESSAKTWAQESKDVRACVYDIYGSTSRENRLPDLSYQYAHDQMPLLEQRLTSGGERVAQRLTEIFSEE